MTVCLRPQFGYRGASGVTLVELMVMVGVLALVAGIVFPAVGSGLDSIRLASAADDVASLLSSAFNRAESRQQPVVITISRADGTFTLESTDPGFSRRLRLPDGVRVEAIHPSPPFEEPGPRHFLVLPGGVVPGIRIELGNARGGRKLVSVDPITQVPEVRQGQKNDAR